MIPQEMLEQDLGKKMIFSKVFEGGDFEAYNEAEAFCMGRGFSVGSMQRGDPVGIVSGDCYISKWRNMTSADKKRLDGAIIGDSKRDGPVTVFCCEKL